MNLKDLNNITLDDLKEIDWNQVKAQILSQPDLLINIALAIVTLFVVFSTFNNYRALSKSSQAEMIELQKQLAAFEKFDSAEKLKDEFLKKAPEAIASDQLIQTLSEWALKRHIQILSFSPAQKKSNKLINLTSVEVNIVSKNYNDIILFVRDIEQSPYPIRLKSWSGSPSATTEAQAGSSRRSFYRSHDAPVKKEFIKATITIESVDLKNA